MRFFNTILTVAVTTAAVVLAAPAAVSNSNDNNSLLATVDNANCEKSTRYACGSYMLEDGTRQDFVSQVFNCFPRDKFICQNFNYQLSDPSHPGEPSHMIAAKIDPGCTCTFYSVACDGSKYTEVWAGWESEPNSPPWNRPAYTDKKLPGGGAWSTIEG